MDDHRDNVDEIVPSPAVAGCALSLREAAPEPNPPPATPAARLVSDVDDPSPEPLTTATTVKAGESASVDFSGFDYRCGTLRSDKIATAASLTAAAATQTDVSEAPPQPPCA